jgi:CBS domain-containing protein
MQIKDVMQRHMETVTPDTPLREAGRKMKDHGVSLLAVCNGPTFVGLLTSRDITVRATAQGCDPRRAQVRDVMMSPSICGREDQNVCEAEHVMRRWQLTGLPVLNHHERLVGVVSLRDVLGQPRSGKGRSRRPITKRGRRAKRSQPAPT